MEAADTSELNSQVQAPTAGLGRKLTFGFAAQGVGLVSSVLTTPIVLRQMGAEGYGLVAFAAALQAWMLVLDLGVVPVLARQLSRFRGGAIGRDDAASLLLASETIFLTTGAMTFIAFLLGIRWISTLWLGPTSLPEHVLTVSLLLIAGLLVLRWVSALYQAALSGLEQQGAVYAVTSGGTVLRNLAGVGLLLFVSRSPPLFFGLNLILVFAEVLISRNLLARSVSFKGASLQRGWALLRTEFHFATGLVVSSLVGTAIYQADKLTLSHTLSLAEYGLFGLVATVCAGIALVVPPLVQAFQPRLTMLLAQDRRAEFAHVYRLCVGVSFVVAIGLAGPIAAFPEWTVFVWTGDRQVANHLAPILMLYAPGAGIAAYLFTPALLQYARGVMRLHVAGYCIFGAVWIPATVWAALAFGAIGTASVWLAGNLLYLAIWVPLVHRNLLARSERRGLDSGVWVRGVALGALLAGLRIALAGVTGRLPELALLGVVSLFVMTLATVSFGETRRALGATIAGA